MDTRKFRRNSKRWQVQRWMLWYSAQEAQSLAIQMQERLRIFKDPRRIPSVSAYVRSGVQIDELLDSHPFGGSRPRA